MPGLQPHIRAGSAACRTLPIMKRRLAAFAAAGVLAVQIAGAGPASADTFDLACNYDDISNACLGVLNGMVDVANRIELGQIRAGMVVSCETAREINDIAIDRMLESKTMDLFKFSLATLTGGSGAIAVLLTDGSFSAGTRRRLVGGALQTAPQFHALCRWGIEAHVPTPLAFQQFAATDSAAVLKHGTTYEVLATNKLDDKFDASPALVGSEVYLRGYRYLYCVAAN